MDKKAEVDAWFAAKRPRSEAAMQRTREIILAADPRVEELVQYEGDGPSARFMRFADVTEVEARADELTTIVQTWCSLMTPGAGDRGPR
jgi:hypothetical protein